MAQIAKETMHTTQYVDRKLYLDDFIRKWRTTLDSTSQLFLGGFNNERLIAFLILKQSSPDHSWSKHIAEFGLMILKDYWSQGLSSKMIQIMKSTQNK